MEQINIQLVWLDETNGLAFQPYIEKSQFQRLLDADHVGFGALVNGKAAGALVGILDDDIFQIEFLMVSEQVRNHGVGHQLIGAAKALTKRSKCTGMVIEFPSPALRELELFLHKQGFSDPVAGSTILKIPLHALATNPMHTYKMPKIKGQILPMHTLSPETQQIYKYQLGRTIPHFVSVEAAGSSVLPEATLGYVLDGQVKAFAVSSELEDGALYLNSIYAEKGHTRALYPLLSAVFDVYRTKYADREALYISAVNENGMSVTSHIVGDRWDQLEQQIMQRMTWQTERERSKTMAEFQYPAIDILVPKLMALKDEAEKRVQSSDLIVIEGNLPMLQLPYQPQQGEEITVEIRYLPLDMDRLDRFVLMVQARVSCEEVPLSIRQLVCDSFNLESLGPMAFFDPVEDWIYLRSCLPEAELPVMPATFGMMIDMFFSGVNQLKENLKTA